MNDLKIEPKRALDFYREACQDSGPRGEAARRQVQALDGVSAEDRLAGIVLRSARVAT